MSAQLEREVMDVVDAADRRHTFRTLRQDMRYLSRVLRRMSDASGRGITPEWDYAYSYMTDARRRLETRYDKETLHRMGQIVCRTYRLRGTAMNW